MRTGRVSLALATLVMVLALAGTASAQCNPEYVSVTGREITVLPTGVDDTANLRCALGLGATMGPGVKVTLKAGTFYTEQLVIAEFRGSFEGAGREATVLRTPEYPLPVYNPCDAGVGAVPCFLDAPPSAANPYPSLVTVITSDATIANMSIRVVGDYGTTRYELMVPGWNLTFIMGAVTVMGPDVSLDITRAEVDAGPGLAFDPETNTWAGGANAAISTAAGVGQGPELTFTHATLRVTDSIVASYSNTVLGNWIEHSRIVFDRNLFVGGMSFSNVLDMQIRMEGNEFQAPADFLGVQFWSGVGLTTDSSLWFANNVFSGGMGILADPGVFQNVKCEAVNNDARGVATPYVWNDNVCKVVAGK